jgi:hypothetical protein
MATKKKRPVPPVHAHAAVFHNGRSEFVLLDTINRTVEDVRRAAASRYSDPEKGMANIRIVPVTITIGEGSDDGH